MCEVKHAFACAYSVQYSFTAILIRAFFYIVEMSAELVKHFVNPVSLTHSGGHFVPATSQDKSTYLLFLENMSRSICLQ